MKELLKELRPLKIKLILEIFINWIIIGLMVGLGLSSIIIIISKFIFVDKILIKIFVAFAVGLAFGLTMAVIKRPNIKKVAIVGDGLGFKERFITAVEILNGKNKDEPISKLLIKDAVETAKNANFKKLYKINISNKRYITLGLAILVMIVSGFMPSWKSEQIKKQAELQKNINNIEELSNKIEEPELKKELKELKKDLKKSKTTSEMVEAIQKTQQQLKKIQNKSVAKNLKELGEKLSENESTKSLGESLKNASTEGIKQQIEKIKDLVNKIPKENLKALSKQIDKIANELSENNELKDLMKSLAESLSSGDYEKATSTIDNISNKLSQLSEENKEIRQAIDKINKDLNSSSKNMQSDKQQNNQQQNNTQQSTKQDNAQPSTKQGGQQSNSQQANGTQQGQGQSSNSSGRGGNGRGQGSIPNENIYTRDLQNIAGTEVQLKGQKNNEGTLEEAEHKGIGEAGEIVSYDKVYEQYKQDALKSLNEYNIPHGMKNLVEEYFSSLSLE